MLTGFLLYETSLGMYFPCMGMMRALYFPNDLRSTLVTILRVPLNFVSAAVLIKVSLFHTRAHAKQKHAPHSPDALCASLYFQPVRHPLVQISALDSQMSVDLVCVASARVLQLQHRRPCP